MNLTDLITREEAALAHRNAPDSAIGIVSRNSVFGIVMAEMAPDILNALKAMEAIHEGDVKALVERLRDTRHDGAQFMRQEAASLIEAQQREIERLREALGYYANDEIYDGGEVPGHIYVLDDHGRYARDAISGKEPIMRDMAVAELIEAAADFEEWEGNSAEDDVMLDRLRKAVGACGFLAKQGGVDEPPLNPQSQGLGGNTSGAKARILS